MPQHFEVQESTAEAIDSFYLHGSGGQITSPYGVRICVGKPSAALYSLDVWWMSISWRLYFNIYGATQPMAARILHSSEPHELPEALWPLPYPPTPVGGFPVAPGLTYYPIVIDKPTIPLEPEPEPKQVKKIYEMELEDYRRGIDKLWKRGVTR